MLLISYPHPLRKCRFLKRYKRFFVDVVLENGLVETVHCANSGSMKSCLIEGGDAYTRDSFNEERKLRHSLELLNLEDGLACLNTSRANEFTEQLLFSTIGKEKQDNFVQANFPYDKFQDYDIVRREVKYSPHTRFDFCLSSSRTPKKCWIEVKSVSLRLNAGTCAFPDAVTERGQRHLIDLMAAKKLGDDAWLFFVIMRGTNEDPYQLAKEFRASHEIDPKYAFLLEEAKKIGVGIAVIVPKITLHGFGLRTIYLY
jgi:sugar fermentation stimulation protein A